MPKSTQKTILKDFDEITLPDTEETVNEIVEEKPLEPEKIESPKIVEKQGKCKNPTISIGHEGGYVVMTLKLDKGDSAMYRVGGGEWKESSKKIFLEQQKATQFFEVKAVNPNKYDSDTVKIPID